MAVTTLQIAQTGSTLQVAKIGTYARWIIFANTAGATMRVGDANTTSTRGAPLVATTGELVLAPMPDGSHYDLGQWWTEGTSTQLLDVIYDSMN